MSCKGFLYNWPLVWGLGILAIRDCARLLALGALWAVTLIMRLTIWAGMLPVGIVMGWLCVEKGEKPCGKCVVKTMR